MAPVHLIRLPELMKRGPGRPEIAVALIDGPARADISDKLCLSKTLIKGVCYDQES